MSTFRQFLTHCVVWDQCGGGFVDPREFTDDTITVRLRADDQALRLILLTAEVAS